MESINALQHIESNPKMYFRNGHANSFEVIQSILGDFLTMSGTDIWVHKKGGWWIVAGKTNWMESQFSLEDMFNQIIPLPEAGPNSMRGEVLVSACSDNVFVMIDGGIAYFKGSEISAEIKNACIESSEKGWTCILAFQACY